MGEGAQDLGLRRQLALKHDGNALDVIQRLVLDGVLLVAQPRRPERRRQHDQRQQGGENEQEERATAVDGQASDESSDSIPIQPPRPVGFYSVQFRSRLNPF